MYWVINGCCDLVWLFKVDDHTESQKSQSVTWVTVGMLEFGVPFTAALVKWKTPDWVPAEARPLTRQSNPNTLVRINTPQTPDPRPNQRSGQDGCGDIPGEAAMHPGILKAQYGINLSSIRGLLLVTVRALHGVMAHWMRECVPHLHGTIIIDTGIVPVSSRQVMSRNSDNATCNTGTIVRQCYHWRCDKALHRGWNTHPPN